MSSLNTIVIISALVCLAQSDNLCENASGRVVDPSDAHKFHVCADQRDVGTIECPTGTLFSKTFQTCIHEFQKETRCENYIRPYRSPEDKHTFVVCVQGRAYVFNCPANLVYDDRYQVCVWDN